MGELLSKNSADRPSRIRNRYGAFAQIPEILVRDPAVSDRAIRIYALLWTYSAEKNRKVWPSRKTMAETLQVSVSTIDRGIRELEERGAIAVEADFHGVRQTSNVYTILVMAEPATVIHRGRKSEAPRLSTGAADLTTPGAANLTTQEEEPQEEDNYPVPQVAHQTSAVDNRTGQNNHPDPRTLTSATHGQPLHPADVFAAVGRQLPDTFDDGALEQLAAEILSRAASRVLDPTGYVIRTIRNWHRKNHTAAQLVDAGSWLVRVDEIARDREFARLTGSIEGNF